LLVLACVCSDRPIPDSLIQITFSIATATVRLPFSTVVPPVETHVIRKAITQ
jgi:hypothetical protein